MNDKPRTFQITLPSFHWKRLVANLITWKAFCLVSILLLGALGYYWATEIRPYVCIPNGTLQVLAHEVVAEESGKISECLAQDVFKKGEVLFATKDSSLLTQFQQASHKMAGNRKEMEGLQGKLDQNMQQYMYVQNELAAQIGPTELTDQILGEIQKLQSRINRLEQETQSLEMSSTLIENTLDAQIVVAPFEGIVLQQRKKAGERVGAGDCVFLICDKERSWIEAEIEEKLLSKMKPGLFAQIEFPAFPGKKWNGQVSWISPIVESGKVKIRLTADALPVRPGLSANTYVKVY
jgi:multidrug resistance efflux pump